MKSRVYIKNLRLVINW